MKVKLRNEYINDTFIKELNSLLKAEYGSSIIPKFNPIYYLEKMVKYYNTNRWGLEFISDLPRPITADQLSSRLHWLNKGVFALSIMHKPGVRETFDAIAVCRWIEDTEEAFIIKEKSKDYARKTLQPYLNPILIAAGFDPVLVWAGNIKYGHIDD